MFLGVLYINNHSMELEKKEIIKQKIASILLMNKEDQTKYCRNLKIIIATIINNNLQTFMENIKEEGKTIFFYFIDLIDYMSKKNKNEREILYETDFDSINDETIKALRMHINKLQDIKFKNESFKRLYEAIISHYEDKRVSLIKKISRIIINMAFLLESKGLIIFCIFSLIIARYMPLFCRYLVAWEDNEINIEDQISLNMICDLLNKKIGEPTNDIQSLIIIKYGALKDILINCETKKIIKAIENTDLRRGNNEEISIDIYLEKMLLIFKEELKNLDIPQKKNRKNKRNNKRKNTTLNSANINNFLIDQSIIPNQEKQQNKIEDNSQKPKEIKSINGKNIPEKNNKLNFWDNLQENINSILDKIISMKNDDNSDNVEELRGIIFQIIDNNREMVKRMDIMNKKIEILSIENREMKKELKKELNKEKDNTNEKIKQLEETIQSLYDEINIINNKNEEIKQALVKIQTRDMSKNFLRCFYSYLTKNDFKRIRKNYNLKGKIISDRIKEKFINIKEKEKLNIVLELIKRSFDSIMFGNDSAQSLTVDYYEEEIAQFKKKNEKKLINSSEIFCFLVALELGEEKFSDAFQFLKKYFDSDLKLINKEHYDGFLNNFIK